MAGLVFLVTLLGSGVIAGVMFAVALSSVPALAAMPPDRYVYTHTLLGKNWDPTMPIIVLGTTLLDVGLAVTADDAGQRSLLIAASVCLLLVSIVSHFRNVPINRVVHQVDPTAIPADWRDPRPLWRRWHLTRTSLAIAALALNAAAALQF